MSHFKQLINPHQHSDSSIDGASTIKQIVKYSKELGVSHVAITEHGNINSAMEMYHSCAKESLKPILGIELYLEPPHMEFLKKVFTSAYDEYVKSVKNPQDKDEWVNKQLKKEYVHLTVHFTDEIGYQHFCKLTPVMEQRAIVKWGERKPLCTLDELRAAQGHITICSGCLIGAVQKWLIGFKSLAKFGDNFLNATINEELAESAYQELRSIAGKDRFYVEVFPHKLTHSWVPPEYEYPGGPLTKGTGFFKPHECTPELPDGDMQRKCNQYMIQLAQKYGDKILISLDSHFATADQKIIQDAKLGNGDEKWKFFNSYHILSSQECASIFKSTLGVNDKTIEEWIDNSYHFASHFNNFKTITSKDRWILQPIQNDFMVALRQKIDRYGRMNWNDAEMVDRLKKEIKVLAFNGKFNLLSYFFTVEDIANFCRNNNVLMNVRGSAGGSLLLYVLGVSAVNPLKHSLSFERFLTEGRIQANTLPDVDMDISDQEKVFDYLSSKYGDGFCRISTDLLLRLKSSIKDAERFINGEVRASTETLTKALPATPQGTEDHGFVFGYEDEQGVHHKGVFETNEALQAWAKVNPDIWSAVSEMLGVQRNKSVHACGCIIAPEPVQNFMPVIQVGDTKATGFSPKQVEQAGGVKYDLLGLNTLRDIQVCLQSIQDRAGVKLDWANLPFDKNSAREFANGLTAAVFQFDTPTIRPYVTKIVKPDQIDNIIDFIECMAAITALGRPGTLDAPSGDGRTLAEVYVARANGEPIEYIHPDLEPIMKVTMGIQLYQEQTLQIFRDIGGFSYEEAEAVRRGIGKKDEKVLILSTRRLREKALVNGWSNEQVDLLIEQIMASARYSFNKSHAISYAYVAYACLYLRTNYKLDWWKAVLDNATKDKITSKFWKHVSSFVEMPSINNTSNSYQIIGDKIVAPMSAVSGLGEKMFEAVVSKAPYRDFANFMEVHFTPKEKEIVNSVKSAVTQNRGRNPLTKPVVRKMIAAGLMDPLFSKEETLLSKLSIFEHEFCRVRDESVSKVKPVNKAFIDLGSEQTFLVRKQMISIYSEDLRDFMLESRGGKLQNEYLKNWIVQDAPEEKYGNPAWYLCVDGDVIDKLKQKCQNGELHPDQRNITFKAVAYVIDEKAFPYKNKSKTANRMVVDIGGHFQEEMLWPKKDEPKAIMGYKGLIVMLTYRTSDKDLRLQSVVPLIDRQKIVNLNSLFSDNS